MTDPTYGAMNSPGRFRDFVENTGSTTTTTYYPQQWYNDQLRQLQSGHGGIQARMARMRADSDRFTLDWICRYCEHLVRDGKHQCRNCGAKR